ncbi:MAG: phosphatidate cytidylyltransferase, partial [Caldisericia bacterium]|nr:phosphatidate cytidylyltransferase [Caldisericia bacterium]
MNSNNLFSRLYVGIIGVLVIGICTIYSVQFVLLFLLIWIFCAVELCRILSLLENNACSSHRKLTWIISSFLLFLFIIAVNIFSHSYPTIPFATPRLLQSLSTIGFVFLFTGWILSIYHLFFMQKGKTPLYSAVMYLALPFTSIILIRVFYGWESIALLFIGNWSMDVFSYVFGMTWGKHKIAPTISPKKSWEGFIGGVIGSMVCFLFFHWAVISYPITFFTLIFSILLPIISFFGDLMQSKIKRLVPIKDSGTILKGQGGIWDRCAGMIFYVVGFSVYL